MRKSKLELYEDVLNALANKPLTIDSIAYQCNMDCIILSQRINFLIKNGLIQEEENHRKQTVYALTKRGTAIFKTLAITKHLEKLQTTIQILDNASQALPALSEHNKERTKRTRRNENY